MQFYSCNTYAQNKQDYNSRVGYTTLNSFILHYNIIPNTLSALYILAKG